VTYPPPLFTGDLAEVSARVRRAGTTPDLVYPNGTRVSYLATESSTRGLFGLFHWEMTAEASGPGRHFHRTLAESFYVLSGSIAIYDGREWVATDPGDFVHVPPGGIHGFRNQSGAPASMLIHFAPGAPREGYFEGLAEFARSGRPSDDEMADFYRRHDNIWV
jgi:mannose-6-phosphate isomerase-like protein (cupin superfamily)